MKINLNFCKENDSYIIRERITNKELVVLIDNKISIIEIFNAIFMDCISAHETCFVEIENTITDDEQANSLFINLKNLLSEISNDINAYLNSMLTQI